MESSTHQETEYKKLTETLMNEGLLKLDAINVDDVAIKVMRRSLVKRVQYIMEQLDVVHCGEKGRRSFRSFLQQPIDGGPRPEIPQQPTIVPKREVWKRFATAYVESASGKAHGRVSDLPIPAPKSAATEFDARCHGIPSGYSLINWDPECKPIILLRHVMDAKHLGRCIYKWTIDDECDDTPVSGHAATAAELWLLLIDLECYMGESEDGINGIETGESREILEGFIESGDRLLSELQKLLPRGRERLQSDGRFEPALESAADRSRFVATFLGTCSPSLSKLMTSIRLWLFRFESNCTEILAHTLYNKEDNEDNRGHRSRRGHMESR